MTINVALLGFGTVGQGVYDTIRTHQEALYQALGDEVRVVEILIKNVDKVRRIHQGVHVTTRFQEVFSNHRIDVVIEAIVGCEPTFDYLMKTLEKGIPVVTANKELMAKKGALLKNIAKENQTTLDFEASVAGGIPILRVINDCLRINQIEKVEAILNGTSNYILTSMREDDLLFETALANAQKLGYAEADPANDILGWDAFYKTMILSDLVFGQQPDWHDAYRVGIEAVTKEEIQHALNSGEKIKLIASLSRGADNHIHAGVKPTRIGRDHPLYGIEGVDNAIRIKTDLTNDLVLSGPGAGALPTASAILGDVVACFRDKVKPPSKQFHQAAR